MLAEVVTVVRPNAPAVTGLPVTVPGVTAVPVTEPGTTGVSVGTLVSRHARIPGHRLLRHRRKP